MKRAAFVALCLLLGLGVSTSAFAHDETMIQKGRELGLSVGNAYACAGPDDKAAFKADSEALFALILHDLGPSYAYVYAVSAGYGASVAADELDCAMHAKQWSDNKIKFGLEVAK